MENNTCPCCKSTLATLASPLTTKLFWHWQHGLVFKKMAISGHSTQYSYTGTWYKVPANQTFRVGCSSQLQVNVCCTSDTPDKSPDYHFFGIDNVDSCSKTIATSGHSTQNAYTGTWYKVLANPMLMLGSSSASNQHLLHLRHPGLPAVTHQRLKCVILSSVVTLW